MERTAWGDERIEAIVSTLLRDGVVLAALVVLTGGIWYLVQSGRGHPEYRVFRGEPADLKSLASVVRDAAALHSRGIIQLGLVLLISTPVARVAFSALAFALQRDRTYVVVTLIVLATLLYSLAGRGP